MRLIAPTMGLWIIGMIILVGSLLVSFNAEAEEEVVLECAGAEVVKNKQKVFTYVFIKGEKITYRTEWESGYREEIYTVELKDSQKVVGWGKWPNGEWSRIEINRVTGFLRIRFRLTDEEKAKAWNDEEQKIGYAKDDEVWSDYSLHCRAVKKLF